MRWGMERQTARKITSYNRQVHTRWIKNVNVISRAIWNQRTVLHWLGAKPHFYLKDYATLWKCDKR